MTDRELLEAAAKAIGLVGEVDDQVYKHIGDTHPITVFFPTERDGDVFAPLDDDGDALRLAVALQMDVFVRGEWAEAVAPMGAPQQVWYSATISKHAATRRAIVRAAAAMVTA